MKLKAPENCGTHVSHAGITYEIKGGVVEVPDGATELFYHGFQPATDPVKAAPAQAPAGGNKGGNKKDAKGGNKKPEAPAAPVAPAAPEQPEKPE